MEASGLQRQSGRATISEPKPKAKAPQLLTEIERQEAVLAELAKAWDSR